MAGGGGLEPPLPGPEPGVLPLDDPPGSSQRRTIRPRGSRSVNARDAGVEQKALADRDLERSAGAELRDAGAGNRDDRSVARMSPVARGASAPHKRPNPRDPHRPPLTQRLAHADDEGGEGAIGGGA